MTPVEYESRCAEMLRTNAHNMSAEEEIERLAYGARDSTAQRLAMGASEIVDDDVEDLRDAVRSAINTLEMAL